MMTNRLRFFLIFICFCATILFATRESAIGQDKPKQKPGDKPKIVCAYPLGATIGKPTKLTLRGLKLDAVTEVQCQEPKAKIKLVGKGKKAGVPNMQDAKRVGDTSVEIELTLPEDFTSPTVTITAVNDASESEPFKLLADRTAAITEKEPNNGIREAELVKFPQEINGVINNAQDVDMFRFEAKAGQKIVAEVIAARNGSMLDSLLTLHSASGQILASNDDIEASTDSKIEAALTKDGIYYLSVIDAHDLGGPGHVYRLSIREK